MQSSKRVLPILLLLSAILHQQQAWASTHGIEFDKKGYVKELRLNLFEPMQGDSLYEFVYGRGRELEKKMLALHSSSALVVNFFQYWRHHSLAKLAVAMGLSPEYGHLRFEKTYPKPEGVGGYRPHVDVELTGTSKPIAIESKFTEPYRRGRKTLKDKYAKTAGIWGKYTGCESLAKQIVEGKEIFQYLDAPQLVKHILGLKTQYKEEGFALVYLWYDFPSTEANTHSHEIKVFKERVSGEIDFREMTFQDLFRAVKVIQGIETGYIDYLAERYFPRGT